MIKAKFADKNPIFNSLDLFFWHQFIQQATNQQLEIKSCTKNLKKIITILDSPQKTKNNRAKK